MIGVTAGGSSRFCTSHAGERDLFYECRVRSVTANTRADGDELLVRGGFADAGVLLTDEGSRV